MKTAIRILSLAIAISVSSGAWAGTSPDPAPPSNEGPSIEVKKRLAEKIDLDLENASVKATIEKVATILGATPLFGPGVEDGPVTIHVKAAPLSNVLDVIQGEAGLRFRIAGDRLLISKEVPRSTTVPSIAGLLADPSVVKRLEPTRPLQPPGGVLELRVDTGSATRSIRGSSGVLDVPGCAGNLGYVRFGRDPFDLAERVVLFDATKGSPGPTKEFGRFVHLGASPTALEMPTGCSLRLGGTLENGVEPLREATGPEETFEQYMLKARIVEVFENEERLLSNPGTQAVYRRTASVQTGAEVITSEGTVMRWVGLDLAVLARRESGQRLLGVIGTVTLKVPTPEGVMTLRLAHGEETLWMTPLQPERITLATTRGHQPSSIVVELTLKVMTR